VFYSGQLQPTEDIAADRSSEGGQIDNSVKWHRVIRVIPSSLTVSWPEFKLVMKGAVVMTIFGLNDTVVGSWRGSSHNQYTGSTNNQL
jgi:hypothetical protein